MDPNLLRLLIIATATIVSAPIVAASLRAFFFFGQMKSSADTAQADIKHISDTMDEFTREMRQAHADHQSHLARHDREIALLQQEMKFGRRSNDREHTAPPSPGDRP